MERRCKKEGGREMEGSRERGGMYGETGGCGCWGGRWRGLSGREGGREVARWVEGKGERGGVGWGKRGRR